MNSQSNQTNELIEIYKIHVEMVDRVSQRRGQTNNYYIGLLTAMIAAMGFLSSFKNELHSLPIHFILVLIAFVGLALCVIWYKNLHSYKQLNSGKFDVLIQLEKRLSFDFYTKEWKKLGKGEKPKKYINISSWEQYISVLFAIVYFIIMCFFAYLTIVHT